MATTRKVAFFGFLLAFLRFVSAAQPDSFSALEDNHAQYPLAPNLVKARNFSVGFSLQSSYGAAAIILTGPDGEMETHTTVFYGGAEYREVMKRLSLESSRHPAPPYDPEGDYYLDLPRQAGRSALKALRLPASYEVGVLAVVVRNLRSQLEGAFGVHIKEAVFTASHLVALYQDDLEDTAINLGLRYVTPRREHHPYVWETASAYAGHGRGLCKAWQNDTECAMEEERTMPEIVLLSVHYSRTALTVSLAVLDSIVTLWEPDYRHSENFSLGREAQAGYARKEDYWKDVQRELLIIMEEFPGFPKPDLIMITGDAADREFIEYLRDAMLKHMGRVPEILSDEPTVVAAKGAAELMRRGPAFWSR